MAWKVKSWPLDFHPTLSNGLFSAIYYDYSLGILYVIGMMCPLIKSSLRYWLLNNEPTNNVTFKIYV